VIINREFITEGLLSVSSEEHHLGGHKFKDGFRVEKALTGWLINA